MAITNIKGLSSNLGNGPCTNRYTISYADLTTAGTTQTLALFTLPQGGKILGVTIKHSTAFRGTAWSACTVSVGSATGGATYYASAFDVYQAVAATTFQDTAEYKSAIYTAEAVNAYFTSTGGNLSVGTAGVVTIDVFFLNYDNG